MTVYAYMLDQRRIEVTGTGYSIEGTFQVGDKPLDLNADEHLALALRIGLLCVVEIVKFAQRIATGRETASH